MQRLLFESMVLRAANQAGYANPVTHICGGYIGNNNTGEYANIVQAYLNIAYEAFFQVNIGCSLYTCLIFLQNVAAGAPAGLALFPIARHFMISSRKTLQAVANPIQAISPGVLA